MQRRGRTKLNAQICEEAAEWLVLCHTEDLTDAQRRAFDDWLRKSPEHQAAYMEIAAIWSEGPNLDPRHRWQVEALVRQAAQDPGNLVSLPRSTVPAAEARPRESLWAAVSSSGGSLRGWRLAAAAVLLVAAVGTGTWFALFSHVTYATSIGEQRTVQLEDGSTLELNSNSKVALRFSRHERAITLKSGQALFQVAKDPSRPFIVSSDGTRVRAVGTEFDVYQKNADTIVTVVEGRVAVLPGAPREALPTDDPNSSVDPLSPPLAASAEALPPAGARHAILVSAGEQLTVTSSSVKKNPHADIGSATAWTEHELIFEYASLADVVAEFNRYNKRPLVIGSTDLDTFHLSGVFSSTDPTSLLQFLRDRPSLRIVEAPSEVRIEKNNSYRR